MPAKKPVLEVNYGDQPDEAAQKKAEFDALIGNWYSTASKLAALTDQEAAMRQEIYDFLYPSDDPRRSEAQTEHFQMPGGWVLKIETRINTTIDRAALDVAKKLILELEADEDGVIPSLDGVITYSPKLSESGYRDAHPKVREILAENQVLQSAPGKPGIKLELPKSAQAKARPKE
jgi:hypothetical protein